MELQKLSFEEYIKLLDEKLHSRQDVFRLSSYPYVSLLSIYKNISRYDYNKIKSIEYDNLFSLLRIVSALLGFGTQNDCNMLEELKKMEPLRSAVIAADQEGDPLSRQITYIELACKILLSKEDSYDRLNVINIRITGKIPALPFSRRQEKANEWFSNLVDIKLRGMRKVYLELGPAEAMLFFKSSIILSLYFSEPYRYDIRNCQSIDDTINEILRTSINHRNLL